LSVTDDIVGHKSSIDGGFTLSYAGGVKRDGISVERERSQGRLTVAIINATFLAAIAAACIGFSILSGEAHYVPAALFAGWCLIVQLAVRRRLSRREHWRRKRKFENAAIGALSTLTMLALLVWPFLGR
jgi:hypothetical protein